MRKVINGEVHYYIVQGDCITECDREAYLTYYREVWRTVYNRMHRQGLCFARSAYVCRGDCVGCSYRKEIMDFEPPETESVEEIVDKRILVETILARVKEDIESGDEILRMRAGSYTIEEIAKSLGITMSMVYRRMQKIRAIATEIAKKFE